MIGAKASTIFVAVRLNNKKYVVEDSSGNY
jgi:hypothetical protein